jgi:DNA helicase HerA-like ATPase
LTAARSRADKTGTGKTVSLQVIAEGLSARGVPVFMADVKVRATVWGRF